MSRPRIKKNRVLADPGTPGRGGDVTPGLTRVTCPGVVSDMRKRKITRHWSCLFTVVWRVSPWAQCRDLTYCAEVLEPATCVRPSQLTANQFYRKLPYSVSPV